MLQIVENYKINFNDLKASSGFSASSMKARNIRDISIAGYGRDFVVDFKVKDISLYTD